MSVAFQLPRSKSVLVALLTGLGFGMPLPAATVVSNLDQPTFGSSPVSTAFWFGNRFVTDASSLGFTLESVTISLGLPGDSSSGLFVALYSDDSSHPGLPLEMLSGTASPAVDGDFTYTSLGLVLAPNTSYWIVAGVAAGAGNYSWKVTDSNLFTGSWSIPPTATHIYSFNQGGQWEPAQDGFARQFSVAAIAVPEPSSVACLGLGGGAWIVFRRRQVSRICAGR